MRYMSRLIFGVVLLGGASACLADWDPLGLYVGAGVGQSSLRQDFYQINSHVTGWKVMAGWHPVSFFGTELEYLNFGSKNVTYFTGDTAHASTHAAAVFALGYLPLPEPWLDIYGKLGAARLQSNANGTVPGSCPPSEPACLVPVPTHTVNDTTSTRFAFGAGAQFKFGLPALRLEYERVTGSQGDQALLSLAVLVNF